MSGKFFEKARIDSDSVSSIASDLESLISSVETFRDELDSYKDELESAKSDLEDADTKEALDAVAKELRGISVPDGCEHLDTTPDALADECDEAEADESEYDTWAEEVHDSINCIERSVNSVAGGVVLPSCRTNYKSNEVGVARLDRPGDPLTNSTRVLLDAENDAWRMAINKLADAASGQVATGDGGAAAMSRDLVERLLGVVAEFMAYTHATGAVLKPTDQPILALMWFVDDLLQEVVRRQFPGNATVRAVLTTTPMMQRLESMTKGLRLKVSEGFGKIDESVNANS
jgi:hypothetical protein